MDKLQITITLSPESAPDLLAYLRQIPGARERAFVFRLLAQRGLRALGNTGTDGLLLALGGMPPTIAPPTTDTPAAIGKSRTTGDEQGTIAPVVSVPADTSIAAPEASPSAVDTLDPPAHLDLAALNHAMARFV
jgi:hypothetical protein